MCTAKYGCNVFFGWGTWRAAEGGGEKGLELARGFGRAGLSLRREYVFLTLFIGQDWEVSGICDNFVAGDDGAEFSGREEMDEERTW